MSDPLSASVPGVQVQLKNLETGIERFTSSNENGYYTVSLLGPGVYRIIAHRDGFRPVLRSRIRLEVGQTLQLDIVLTLGGVTEAIQVTDDEPLGHDGVGHGDRAPEHSRSAPERARLSAVARSDSRV